MGVLFGNMWSVDRAGRSASFVWMKGPKETESLLIAYARMYGF